MLTSPKLPRPSIGDPSRSGRSRTRDQSPGACSVGSQASVEDAVRPVSSINAGAVVRRSTWSQKYSSRDPRPVGDKAYTVQCAKTVAEFLHSHGFNRMLSMEKLLREPTTKDFFDVFKFLISHIDPSLTLDGKMEDEVPGLMKRLKYPVDVNKSKLLAIQGPNTWPQLLAVLDWLVNLVSCIEEALQPIAACQVPLQDPGETDYDEHGHILQAAMQKNYQLYLNLQDDGEDEARLRQIYEDRIASLTGEVDRAQEQWTFMEQRLGDFHEQHERLLELRVAPQHLEAEADRIQGVVQQNEENVTNLERDMRKLATECSDFQREIEDLQVTSRKLTEQIEAQSYSKKDIERLKGERSHLRSVLSNLQSDCELAEQGAWELGIEESRLTDVLHRALRQANEKLETYGQLEVDAELSTKEEWVAKAVASQELLEGMSRQGGADEIARAEQDLRQEVLRVSGTASLTALGAQHDSMRTELGQVLDSQRAVQEQLAFTERENRHLKVRLEQLQRLREEHREWSINQLEEAQRTAEETEDAVHTMAMDGGPCPLQDVAEADQLRLQLAALKAANCNEKSQAEEQLKRQQEKFAGYKKLVEAELETYVQQMEEIAAETIKLVQDEMA